MFVGTGVAHDVLQDVVSSFLSVHDMNASSNGLHNSGKHWTILLVDSSLISAVV
jgi:hypothetical protein